MNHAPNRRIVRRIVAAAALAAAAVSLTFPRPAGAEQPSWASIRHRTFVIRYHGTSFPADSDTSGIWDFDPLTGAYQRLRPFHYNATMYGITDFWGAAGQGSYLATMDDRVVFIAWPSIEEFDAATMRVIRRYPVLEPSLEAYGWAIQGPIIDTSLAEKTGLPEGMYGFARCLYPLVASGGIFPVEKDCQPTLFPGAADAISSGTLASVLLRQPMSTPESRTLSAGRGLDPEHWAFGATFDPNRVGFWLLGGTNLAFHPVTDGQVAAATTTVDLTGPPLDNPDLWLDSIFYHPTRKFFLLEWEESGKPQHLSVLSDSLDRKLTDDAISETGAPVLPLAFAAFAGDPPAEKEQTIPIVAHTSGKNGTFWTSDLYLYNPSSEATTVSIRRVTRPDVTKTVELPGHGSAAIPDVLVWAGGGPSGDGTKHDALVLTTDYRWGENLVAAARVGTPASDPLLRAAGGTMGQAVPAVPDTVGYSNHLAWDATDNDGTIYSKEFPGNSPATLILDYRQPGRFRHNLGVVNDGDHPLTVRLTWASALLYLEDGGADSQRSFDVPAHSVKEISIEKLFPSEIRSSYFPRLWVVADRAASIWFSMVDNISGDAVFVPYTLFDQLGDHFTRAAVPVAAHLPGKKGTFWQTDLYTAFSQPTSLEDTPKSWFHPSNPGKGCGGATGEISQQITGVLPMDPATWLATLKSINYPLSFEGEEPWAWRSIFPDLVHRFDACASDDNVRGGFEMKEGSWMGAYTRTYTTRSDGGTYGGMLPLYPPHGWPVQHFAGLVVSPEFRINVGLYNGDADHAITHRLTLYDADGNRVAENEIALQPWANLIEPLETILGLAKASLPAGTYGLTVLPLDDQANGVDGRSWAFVSLVDNLTGDSTNWW